VAQGSSSPEIALLPIHPEYAFAILRGEKKVEFRKRPFRRNVDFVAIYATAPVKRIIGVFRIEKIEEGSPSSIWRRFHSIGCISRQAFRRYYSGAKSAVAIQVSEVRELPEPICLSQLDSVSGPPQSFVYLCKRSQQVLLGDAVL